MSAVSHRTRVHVIHRRGGHRPPAILRRTLLGVIARSGATWQSVLPRLRRRTIGPIHSLQIRRLPALRLPDQGPGRAEQGLLHRLVPGRVGLPGGQVRDPLRVPDLLIPGVGVLGDRTKGRAPDPLAVPLHQPLIDLCLLLHGLPLDLLRHMLLHRQDLHPAADVSAGLPPFPEPIPQRLSPFLLLCGGFLNRVNPFSGLLVDNGGCLRPVAVAAVRQRFLRRFGQNVLAVCSSEALPDLVHVRVCYRLSWDCVSFRHRGRRAHADVWPLRTALGAAIPGFLDIPLQPVVRCISAQRIKAVRISVLGCIQSCRPISPALA